MEMLKKSTPLTYNNVVVGIHEIDINVIRY